MYPDPYGSPFPDMPPPSGPPANLAWPSPPPLPPPPGAAPPLPPPAPYPPAPYPTAPSPQPQYAPPQYAPPFAPPPAPVSPGPSGGSKNARVFVASLVTVALVAIGAAAGSVLADDSPVYPERWDPRVADLARFVEQHRGHRFKHPVQVYFLSEERYSDIAGGGPDRPEPTSQDRKQAERAVAEYRALGLMQGAPDLFASNETLQDSGTLAFYSPEDDVVNVRGTKLTAGLRVTLVHELTHALQDQYFDLSPLGASNDADRAGAVRAVIEGDAVAVENDFIETLSDADRAAYETESQQGGDQAQTDLAEVPAILQVLFGSYYAVGNAFVELWRADPSGTPRPSNADALLKRPPRGSYQLFEPVAYLDDVPEIPVSPPDAKGLVIDRGVHGVDLLFLMLAERIDPLAALAATDGWRGDAFTASVGRDGTVCVVSTVNFATDADVSEYAAALEEWSSTMPKDPERTVTPDTERLSVTLDSCDPGADADIGLTGRAGEALRYPVTRLQVAALGVREGRDRESALCYGQEAVNRLTMDDLRADERTPAIDAALEAADAACP